MTGDPFTYMTIMLAAIVISAANFILSSRIGFNRSDEGYLWYGTQQVLSGKVPIRDFRAYDPGRYYWCALWMSIFGQGFIALRLALALFKCVGLSFGMLVVFNHTGNIYLSLFSGLILNAWTFPHWKTIDISWCTIGAYVASLIVQNPCPETIFWGGVFVGLSWLTGLNHALYCGLAIESLTIVCSIKLAPEILADCLTSNLLGLTVGLIPMAAILLLIPGMHKAYWQRKIEPILTRGSTNLPRPIPWPWKSVPAHYGGVKKTSHWCQITGYWLPPIFNVCILLWMIPADKAVVTAEASIVACAFLGLFYMHAVWSRADLSHLAQSIHPFLLGAICLASNSLYVSLAVGTVMVLWTYFAIVLPKSLFLSKAKSHSYVESKIMNDRVWLPQQQAKMIDAVRSFVKAHADSNKSTMIVPRDIGLYPALGITSPVYDTFSVYPATSEEERIMLEEMQKEKVDCVLVNNGRLMDRDGQMNLYFANTHPQVWTYLDQNYQTVPLAGMPRDYVLFLHKAKTP